MTQAPPGQSSVPGLQPVQLVEVTTPRGHELPVMGIDEALHYEQSKAKYLSQAVFDKETDLADLESILFMELCVHRWSTWIAQGREYDGNVVVNDNELRRKIQDFTKEIRATKSSLMLDRKTRETASGDTFEARWTRLARYAKEFGLHRVRQSAKSMELMQDIFATIAVFDRSNEAERERLGVRTEVDLVAYIRGKRPEFDEVDEYFRHNEQRYWSFDTPPPSQLAPKATTP